ncbi:hypothetical protein [Pseudomonas sp. MF6787]|uniref:hypothetical protein n=1 Tax=Pseudomonas sp. MF6787 TaxID=2797536 RepID=UPI0018E7FA80|nr:hypothetical protein [Pseudomonas sp. MF6787]MBJ2265144.1 hypothetical protein [Pseudomonas sp. MF6787]
MVNVVEILLELEASNFNNTGRSTRGRVVRTIPGGDLSCQVDDGIKSVAEPQGTYDSIDDARNALIEYWGKCNIALQSEFWKPKLSG